MAKSSKSEFGSVDRTENPTDFVRYLDRVRRTALFREIKGRLLELMDLRSGEAVLDVGCGTGEDVRTLAERLEPRGIAIGVDISQTMIATAKQRSHQHVASARFVVAAAERLPFDSGCFDAVRAERLLQHVSKPDDALREMIRVTKHGGRLAIWEGDLDLLVFDAPDLHASRCLQQFICDRFQNGTIGRRLYRMFLESGLMDVQVFPLLMHITNLDLVENAFDLTASVNLVVERGLLESKRAALWLDSLRAASTGGRFFSAVGGFITCGLKI